MDYFFFHATKTQKMTSGCLWATYIHIFFLFYCLPFSAGNSSSVFSMSSPTAFTTISRDDNIKNNLIHVLSDFDITTNKVFSVLRSRKTNKNPGIDNVYSSLIKETKGEMLSSFFFLFFLFNMLVSQGIVPSDWQMVDVLMVDVDDVKQWIIETHLRIKM